MQLLRLRDCTPWVDNLEYLQMRHVDCNSPVTTGYSAYCWRGAVYRFYSHTSTSTIDIYEDTMPENQWKEGVWVYFPINNGESLKSIIRRTMIPGSFYGSLMGISLIVRITTYLLLLPANCNL